MSPVALAKAMRRTGSSANTPNINTVQEYFASLTDEMAAGLSSLSVRVFHGVVQSGEVLYIPPGYLCAVGSLNGNPTSGIRFQLLPLSSGSTKHLEELQPLVDEKTVSAQALNNMIEALRVKVARKR